jgi:hypothetical protein
MEDEHELSDEQDYWMNVRQISDGILSYEDDDLFYGELVEEEVAQHLQFQWRQLQAMRWTENLDALSAQGLDYPANFAEGAIAEIALQAMMADVKEVMKRSKR